MSIDFVARALAQQAGQAQAFTTLATAIGSISIPATVKAIRTSGYSVEGIGGGIYVNDALATLGLAQAHPRFCKTDADGRHWRLLPDDAGLIPVGCGGASGTALSTAMQETLNDSTTGLAAFSAAPWATNAMTLASAGIPGPGGLGNATTMTETGGPYSLLHRPAGTTGLKIVRARVKAGTASRIYLYSNSNPGNTTLLKGCWFDPAAGIITHDEFGTGKIVALGNGWYQIEITAQCYNELGIGLSDGDNATTVTAGHTGVLFDIDYYDAAIVSSLGLNDDRPAIQDAIEYCEAVDAAGTRYDAANYSLWRVSRSLSAPFDIHADKSGLLLKINKTHRFVSACGGTTLWRRDTDGGAMSKSKFDVRTGYYWRGGGIFVDGQSTLPASPSENSIYLYDIMLDGGITDSSEQNNPYGPSMQANGDGWDLSDKGIWQANDRYCGDIVLAGLSGIRYFMGELVYSSGIGAAVADRVISIGPDVNLGHTCGSCINANGATLKVERCLLHHAFMGFEGWTGHLGGYFKAAISDCNRNTIQGGIPNFGAGSYFAKSRPKPDVAPIGYLDVLLNAAGSFEVGSWLYGRIEAIDCSPTLGNLAAFSTGCQDVQLEITTWADQTSPAAAVALLGGASGTRTTDRVSLVVSRKRTDEAAANGRLVSQDVYSYGSFGPEVSVTVTTHPGVGGAAPAAPAGVIYDNAIKVLGWSANIAATGPGFDMETNNNGTIDVLNTGNSVGLFATTQGSFNVNLPTAGIPVGYRLFLYNMSGNYLPQGATARIPASNFRDGRDLIIPTGYGYTELEFEGQKWSVVVPPPAMTASASWDPASVAAGASTTTTVSLTGTVIGDRVQAGFSNDLQGMMLSAHVSAANTVTAVLFNPTGSAIDLASGTLRVTVA